MHNPPLPSRRALLGAAFTLLATTGAGMAEAQDPRQPRLPSADAKWAELLHRLGKRFTAVHGVMLLDTLVPGIAPWKAAAQGEPWSVDASLNAMGQVATLVEQHAQ